MSKSLRYRLYLLSAALLYLGPLLGGLAGLGWQMIPAFCLMFALWLLVMRPKLVPARLTEWADGAVIGRAVLWMAGQAVIVSFCLGIGRGIGATLGTVALVPDWVPLLMSLMSVPLARVFWNREAEGAARDEPLPTAKAESAVLARCRDWIARLGCLPQETDTETLIGQLAEAKAGCDPVLLLEQLAEACAVTRPNPVLRRAFILLATDAEVAGKVLGKGQLARAFDLAGEDAGRLQLFAERTMAALQLRRVMLVDAPTIQRVRDVAKRHPAAGSALMALSDQMHRLSNA